MGVCALPAAQAACTAERRAELPLTPLRNFLLVPASLDGATAVLAVDTGAETTLSPPKRWRNFIWPGRRPHDVAGRGRGGAQRRHGAAASAGSRRAELDGLSLPMSARCRGCVAPAADRSGGLLGLDVLASYDIALDPPPPHDAVCGAALPGVRAPPPRRRCAAAARPADASHRADRRQPVAKALLDTGARSSLLGRLTWRHCLGVTDGDLFRDPVDPRARRGGPGRCDSGATGSARSGWAAPPSATWWSISRALPVPGVDMLLGADWLSGRKLWISRAAGRLFQR